MIHRPLDSTYIYSVVQGCSSVSTSSIVLPWKIAPTLKLWLASSSAMSELITQAGVLAPLDVHSESYSTRGSCAQPVGCSLSLLQNPHHHCAVQCNRPPRSNAWVTGTRSVPGLTRSRSVLAGDRTRDLLIQFPELYPYTTSTRSNLAQPPRV